MKKLLLASAASLGALVAAPEVARASDAQLVFSVNAARNDARFGYLSYRRAIGGDLKTGLGYRFDLSRSSFDFLNGAVPTTGTTDTARVLLTYGSRMQGYDLMVFGGASYKNKSFSPPGALATINDFGAFAGFEISQWSSGTGGLQVLAEVETQESSFYTRATYLFDFGSIEIGPTAHFLQETGYDRRGAGLWMNYGTGNGVVWYGSVIAAQGGGATHVDSSAIEIGATIDF